MPGVVVDDDRRASEHDGQAGARLEAVTQVAQQQGSGHTGDEDPVVVDDQPTVEERQRRTDQPDGRGCSEREPMTSEQAEHDGGDRCRLEPKGHAGRGIRVVPNAVPIALATAATTIKKVETVLGKEQPDAAHPVNVRQLARRPRPTKVGRPPPTSCQSERALPTTRQEATVPSVVSTKYVRDPYLNRRDSGMAATRIIEERAWNLRWLRRARSQQLLRRRLQPARRPKRDRTQRSPRRVHACAAVRRPRPAATAPRP